MGSSLRERMKANLNKRTEGAYQKRNRSSYLTIFKDDVEVPFWRPDKGEHIIDIIPYEAGDLDPDQEVNKGDFQYVLDIMVHRNIGPADAAYVCPLMNYDEPCPICEFAEFLRGQEDVDEEFLKGLRPKRRTVYNILSYDAKDEKEGNMLWEVAHFFFEKKVLAIAKRRREGGFVNFSSPDKDGKSIEFEIQRGKDNMEFLGHKFSDRDYDIADDDLSAALCLDNIVRIPDLDELERVVEMLGKSTGKSRGGGDSSGGEDRRGRRGGRGRSQQDTESGDGEKGKSQNRGTDEDVPFNKCPEGGVFGADVEKFKERCGGCELFDPCSAENDRMKEQNRGSESSDSATAESSGGGSGRGRRSGRSARGGRGSRS